MSHDLNPSQRAAVEHEEGPLLVLAGAGSGKTRVVTRRIARLISRGTPAWSIVAVTFTNKAAAEMKERVRQLTDAKTARELSVTTFHSFGLQLLSGEARSLGLRGGQFTIYDQADCTSTVRELLRTLDAGRRFDIGAILGRISVAKNAFETEETWRPRPNDEYDEIAREIFPKYVAALKAFQAFDFDDLVTETVRLLQRREDVRRRWQSKIRYLLVDEYQDTNASQLELVRLLAGERHNVMVVGDDDQSIYAWRGADVTNILDFERHFSGAKVVKLEENYRSHGAVLAVANAVLASSQARRHGKVLRATRAHGPTAELVVCTDPEIEANMIADEIEKARSSDPTLKLSDIAVLYRSNAQSEPVELALKERGLSHRQLGGQKFYERKEVKDLFAYLRAAIHHHDEISVRRVLNYPARGIGEAAMTRLSHFATARDLTLFQAIQRAGAIDELPKGAVEGCAEFEKVVLEARAALERGEPSHAVTRAIAERIGLKEDIHVASPGEAAARRWGNVESLLNVLRRRDERGPNDLEAIAEYVRLLSLSTDAEEKEADAITLSTMHGAKGLEFRLVFVAGIEEGFLPHQRTLDPKTTDVLPQDIEEERRLFYVAVTRAKDRLVMSRAKFRALRGKPTPRTPSRFLDAIAKELVVEREVTAKLGPKPEELEKGASALLAALGASATGSAPLSHRPFTRRR